MNDARLTFILRAPALVERVARRALREALRSRRYRTGSLDVRTFAHAALSELERVAAITRLDVDAVGRLELQNAVVSAAGCFASSALARRLFELPIERFGAIAPEVDAVVSDAARGLHLVRLELVTNDAARSELSRAIARAYPAPPHGTVPQVHLFSLRDGRMRSSGVHQMQTSQTTNFAAVSAISERRSA